MWIRKRRSYREIQEKTFIDNSIEEVKAKEKAYYASIKNN